MSADTALEVGRLYAPLKTIADVLTASQNDIFVRLPGLEAYWPGGIRDGSGKLIDHSAGGHDLAQTGTPQTDFDGNSYVHLGSGVNYFSSVGVGAISGTETYIRSTIRGLTVGGWFMADAVPVGNNFGIVSKWGGASDRAYGLRYLTTSVFDFSVSGTGSTLITATSPTFGIGVWRFIVGRYTPSTEVALFVDGEKAINSTAVPASIFNSTQIFEMGRFAANSSTVFNGKARDVFLCAAVLSDELIAEIRASSQP